MPSKTLEEYTKEAAATAQMSEPWYFALGLAGEAGEAADQVKKMYRNEEGEITPDRRAKIIGECGDTMWYIAMLLKTIGSSMDEAAEANIKKLSARAKAGTIKGR